MWLSECGRKEISVWWNDGVKAAGERKELLGARDEVAKERCMEAYKRK